MIKEKLDLYFISGSQDVQEGQLVYVLEKALQAGITMFQFREKGKNSLERYPKEKRELAIQCQSLCQAYQVPFIVNDDVDLALSLEADGVHVGQDDEPIADVLKTVPSEMIVGLSTSNQTEFDRAEEVEGLDYIGLGPVFSTSSKKDTDPELGLEGLKDIMSRRTRVPVVAIGGISSANAKKVRATGVDGISVISAIAASKNIEKAVRQLKEAGYER